ncbi:hypothetical protein [Streptomyces sp. TE33382]
MLRLLPDSPVVVLTRAPIGIMSSFERGRLWERWAYGERYTQLAGTARSPRLRDFASLVPLDDPAAPVALGRLIALNALLLAESLSGTGRDVIVVSYEQHVGDRQAVLSGLAHHLGITLPSDTSQSTPGAVGHGVLDSTFVTTRGKDGLVAELDPGTADLVRSTVAATMTGARAFLNEKVTANAAEWLAGDDRYEVRQPTDHRRNREPRCLRGPFRQRPTSRLRAGRCGGTNW